MGDRHIALLRGINVGRAKRVRMADLRGIMEELGFTDVRTLLNSGNVVFTVPGARRGDTAAKIGEALEARTGVSARVTVLTAAELAVVVRDNPLLDLAIDPTRLQVAFLAEPAQMSLLEPVQRQEWGPEAIALGSRVAYLWCPDGLLASRLPEAVGRLLGDGVTTRNWSTVSKLGALLEERP